MNDNKNNNVATLEVTIRHCCDMLIMELTQLLHANISASVLKYTKIPKLIKKFVAREVLVAELKNELRILYSEVIKHCNKVMNKWKQVCFYSFNHL
jgi:hypothetical protein